MGNMAVLPTCSANHPPRLAFVSVLPGFISVGPMHTHAFERLLFCRNKEKQGLSF